MHSVRIYLDRFVDNTEYIVLLNKTFPFVISRVIAVNFVINPAFFIKYHNSGKIVVSDKALHRIIRIIIEFVQITAYFLCLIDNAEQTLGKVGRGYLIIPYALIFNIPYRFGCNVFCIFRIIVRKYCENTADQYNTNYDHSKNLFRKKQFFILIIQSLFLRMPHRHLVRIFRQFWQLFRLSSYRSAQI